MKLNDLRLGLRLAAGFGLVLALVPVIAGLGWWRLQATQVELAAVTAIKDRALAAAQWKGLTHLNVSRTLAIAKSGGHKDVQAYFEPLMKQTTAQISELQRPLEAGATAPDEQALMADIAARRKLYLSTRSAIFGLLDIDDPGAKEALESRLMPSALAYITSISSYQVWQQKQAEAAVVVMNQRIDQAQGITGALLVLCLGLGIGCAWTITRSVTLPLARAAAAARTMAGGDLSQTIASEGRDEVGDLLEALEAHAGLAARRDRRTASFGAVDPQCQQRSRWRQPGPVQPHGAGGSEPAADRVVDGAADRHRAPERRVGAHRQPAGLASAAVAAQRGGEVVSQVVATMERDQQPLEPHRRHHRRDRRHRLPDQHPGAERRGRGRTRRRAGPRLRGGGQRGAQPGAALAPRPRARSRR